MPLDRSSPVAQRVRSVWISDVHLGSKGCRAEFLNDFLRKVECEYLFLVGDIVDIWAMRRGVYWPLSHNEVIQTILKKSRKGVKVIYVPGNHDELLREYMGSLFGNIEICHEYLHTTTTGKRLLLMHGDEFDKVVTCGKIKELLGNVGYDFLIWLNRAVHFLRRNLGLPYWSLAGFLKKRVKEAMKHIETFENTAAYEAKRRGADGIVCGHVHHPNMREIEGVLYCNDGDWVENCTSLVEHLDGSLELIHWIEETPSLKLITPHTPLDKAA